jgi:hypothetical protein
MHSTRGAGKRWRHARALIAEEMSLRDLPHARELTQQRMAECLGIGQEGGSRLEKRTDLWLSTLRIYVEAMGGRLRLVAEFPDRPPVDLAGLAIDDGEPAPRKRAKSTRP